MDFDIKYLRLVFTVYFYQELVTKITILIRKDL